MPEVKELDMPATRARFGETGRTLAGYARANGWSSDSFRSYMTGAKPLTPGGKAWALYVPKMQEDGLAVFKT